MRTIWKYPLQVTDTQEIAMPGGAELLAVQMQNDTPTLWARVDTVEPYAPRRIVIVGTGNPGWNGVGEYIGTFQMHGGALVFHAFEVSI